MGNPELRTDYVRPPPAPPGPGPAPAPMLQWRVCWLRARGVKLDRDAALATERLGHLTVTSLTGPEAVLTDRHGNELGRLEGIQIRQLLPTGGMLLYGREFIQRRTRLETYPQAWWCVVHACPAEQA